MLQEQSRLFQRILLFADLALVFVAWGLAYVVRFDALPWVSAQGIGPSWLMPPETLPFSQYARLLPGVLIGTMGVFYASGIYAEDRVLNRFRLSYSVVKAAFFGLVFVAALVLFYRQFYVSRLLLVVYGLLLAGLMIGLRLALFAAFHRLRTRGRFLRRVLVVGAGPVGQRVARTLQDFPWAALDVIGFAADDVPDPALHGDIAAPDASDGAAPHRPIVCQIADVPALADRMEAGGTPLYAVYITLPLQALPAIEALTNALSTRTVQAYLVPDLFGMEVLNARVSDLDGLPVLHLLDRVPLRLAWVGKRAMDVGIALGVLVVLSPLLAAIAAAVKATSPGPVFYRQERVGLDGRRFEMLKFRSMRSDHGGDVALLTSKDDPRVTRVGAFLRRTSLDELPQFVNVLKGDMAVVGPRPERTWVVEAMRAKIPRYMLKHKVPAGITGWAQVNGWRGDTSLESRIEHDLYYIQNWSLKLDVKIMLLTVWRGMIRAEHAY